MSDPVNS